MANFKFNKEHKHWLTHSSPYLLATLLALPSAQLQAASFDEEEDEEDAPLTTQRLNEYTNSAEIVVRKRDNDSGKFGEYNALEDQRLTIDGNVYINNTDYEGGTAEYYKLRAEDLGTENREIEVEVGKQGSHSFNFTYEESERQVWDSFDTPYNLSNDQTLPAGFPDLNDGTADTEASVSSFMTEHELKLDREKLSLGYMRKLAKGWTFNAGYSHENKDGHKDLGLMDGTSFQPIIFALPVEYKTDTANLALEYVAKDYQVQFAYEVSAFDNGSTSTVIDSPYTAGTRMRIAQEPDNLFQQISVNGNFRFSPVTRATWFLAYNEATQDEDLLSINENQPGLGTGTG
ncbi:MAG: MtrB/PioB family outer membrane beta-barrel protein, partial [Motiliproteus sp.]